MWIFVTKLGLYSKDILFCINNHKSTVSNHQVIYYDKVHRGSWSYIHYVSKSGLLNCIISIYINILYMSSCWYKYFPVSSTITHSQVAESYPTVICVNGIILSPYPWNHLKIGTQPSGTFPMNKSTNDLLQYDLNSHPRSIKR